MRFIFILILIATFYTASFAVEVKNSDKPLNGQWDFKMRQAWMVEKAGEDVFALVISVKTSNDGNVYVMDRKNYKVYIIAKTGEYLSSFGSRGEGPGGFSILRKLFLVGDYIIVVDDGNIHYFSQKGKYVKSFKNNFVALTPMQFIDSNTFISVSIYAGLTTTDYKKGEIAIYDMNKNAKQTIYEFPRYEKNTIQVNSGNNTSVYSFSVDFLTPQMVFYYKNNKIYLGMSDKYRIKVTKIDGSELFNFGLKKERKKVSDSFKKEVINGFNFPSEVKKLAKKNLPDYLNCFEQIYIDDNGFIYVFEPPYEENNLRKVDIFSSNGKYLYASGFKVREDHLISDFHIAENSLYLVLEDKEGEIKIAKYWIVTPR